MTFASEAGDLHGNGGHAGNGHGADGDWVKPEPPQRDWKKLILMFGLGTLSWVATYVGMLELIEANMGELPLTNRLIIGFAVAMLMTMIIWLLDQLFSPNPFFTKLAYVGGYIFLTLISVGFGFGFYWKVLESRSEASRSAESAVTQVQSALHGASTRLTQLQATLDQLAAVSSRKAEEERASGASCPNSRPGDGPRRRLRDADATRFGFASEFVKGRVGNINGDIATLEGSIVKIAATDGSTVSATDGTRNEFMRSLSRRLDMTVTGFNAFRSDPQLRQIRADLAERADKSVFPDGKGGTFSCPDLQLQTALRGVVRAIDQLPELEKPQIAAVEGSEATIEAFRRLTATFYGALALKLPPSADELRQLQLKAVQSVNSSSSAPARDEVAGLSKRDYIPLSIAIFVDLCLLLVAMGRPANRLQGLIPKMHAAESGPVYQILSKFSAIHRDAETRRTFEVFRHVVFDFHGDYYIAVPLDAPYRVPSRKTPAGVPESYDKHVADLQLEAHLLANLFAGFEKEKIFSRVYSPFLSTRTIQNKLQRQGSKFAHARAFRVYRFREGAWSEIILGAVMGAARSSSHKEYKAQLAKAQREQREQEAAAAAERARQTSGIGFGGETARTQEEIRALREMFLREMADLRAEPTVRGDYGFSVTERPRHQRTEETAPLAATGTDGAAPPSTAAAPDPDLKEKFGPYAAQVASERFVRNGRPVSSGGYRRTRQALDSVQQAHAIVGEADVDVRIPADNSNTAPPQWQPAGHMAEAGDGVQQAPPPPEPAAEIPAAELAVNVIPMRAPYEADASQNWDAGEAYAPDAWHSVEAQAEAAEPAPEPAYAVSETVRLTRADDIHAEPMDRGIDVVVRRETATFTVPVSEGRLSQSLANMLREKSGGIRHAEAIAGGGADPAAQIVASAGHETQAVGRIAQAIAHSAAEVEPYDADPVDEADIVEETPAQALDTGAALLPPPLPRNVPAVPAAVAASLADDAENEPGSVNGHDLETRTMAARFAHKSAG